MEELVKGFVDGQISRRVFIRRLVTAGVALTGAVAYADLLAADPAAAAAFSVYVTDYAFTPQKSVVSGPGDYVSWIWNGASGHTVSETSGVGLFDSSKYGATDEWATRTGTGSRLSDGRCGPREPSRTCAKTSTTPQVPWPGRYVSPLASARPREMSV